MRTNDQTANETAKGRAGVCSVRVLIHFALPDTHTGGETAIRAITEKEEEEEEEKTDVAQLWYGYNVIQNAPHIAAEQDRARGGRGENGWMNG